MAPLDPAFRDEILHKIATFDPEKIREAVHMLEALPEAGEDVADDVAQLIHDVALHAESMEDCALCSRLYLRATTYRTANPQIPSELGTAAASAGRRWVTLRERWEVTGRHCDLATYGPM